MVGAILDAVFTVHRASANALFRMVVFAGATWAGLVNCAFGSCVGAQQALDFRVTVHKGTVWALDR